MPGAAYEVRDLCVAVVILWHGLTVVKPPYRAMNHKALRQPAKSLPSSAGS
jgi:hypothetical protein